MLLWIEPSERSWNDEKATQHQKPVLLNLPHLLDGAVCH